MDQQLPGRSQPTSTARWIIINFCPIESGVSQGSVLGPLLFILYINDIPKYISTESVARLFADDRVLHRRIYSEEGAHKLQKDLDGLQKWKRDWLIEFHSQKCQTMHIINKRKPITVPYIIYVACVGALGIQDICHFTSRDIGYFPFYFQGYGILRSISGILVFFLQNIKIQRRNTNNINKNRLKFSTKGEQLYVQDMASLSRIGPLDRV